MHFLAISPKLHYKGKFRVTVFLSKTAIANNFYKTGRDCEHFLHFYQVKIVNIDMLLLWRSVSCIKAFNVTKIHIRILMNRYVQSYYTQRDRLFLITPLLKLIMSTIYKWSTPNPSTQLTTLFMFKLSRTPPDYTWLILVSFISV